MSVMWGRSTAREPLHAYDTTTGMSLCELSSIPEGFQSLGQRTNDCCANCAALNEGKYTAMFKEKLAEKVTEGGQRAMKSLLMRLTGNSGRSDEENRVFNEILEIMMSGAPK